MTVSPKSKKNIKLDAETAEVIKEGSDAIKEEDLENTTSIESDPASGNIRRNFEIINLKQILIFTFIFLFATLVAVAINYYINKDIRADFAKTINMQDQKISNLITTELFENRIKSISRSLENESQRKVDIFLTEFEKKMLKLLDSKQEIISKENLPNFLSTEIDDIKNELGKLLSLNLSNTRSTFVDGGTDVTFPEADAILSELKSSIKKINVEMEEIRKFQSFERIDSEVKHQSDTNLPREKTDSKQISNKKEESSTLQLEVANLRESFPKLAYLVIQDEKVKKVGDNFLTRLTERFFAVFTTRSLTPQVGETTDAILSRAEESLRNGDISSALMELESLSNDSKAAFAEWIDSAEAIRDETK